jgi:hypothetical protein
LDIQVEANPDFFYKPSSQRDVHQPLRHQLHSDGFASDPHLVGEAGIARLF